MQGTLNFDKDMDCTHPSPSLELGNAVKKVPDCLFGHENQAGCCGFWTRVSLGDSGISKAISYHIMMPPFTHLTNAISAIIYQHIFQKKNEQLKVESTNHADLTTLEVTPCWFVRPENRQEAAPWLAR